MMRMKIFTKRNLIIALLVVFLFLRLFVPMSSVSVGSDKLKYIEASKNFPFHTLYNNQLYLLHPPFYPYVIHFFDLFMDDRIGAILFSLISAVITFFILYKLFMMLTKDFNLTFFTLLFLTLSVSFISLSRIAMKESFTIMLTALVIYHYIKGVKFESNKSIMASSIFVALFAVTSDHVVFLFPVFVWSYIFFNSKKINLKKLIFPNLKYAIIPIIVMVLFYGSWTFIKFYQYSNYEFYPNGYSGMPLSTHDLGFFQVITPQKFEDYGGTYMGSGIVDVVKKVVFNFGYMLNMEPFSIPRGLNFSTMKFLLFPHHIVYMVLIYLPLAIIALYGLYRAFNHSVRINQIHNNVNVYIFGLFLIFMFPITQKYMGPRYIYTAYIFFFYFISYGVVTLLKKKTMSPIRSKVIPGIVIFLLLVVVPVGAYNNNYLVLFTKKSLAAQNTGDFINNNLPQDAGIMAQAGYTVKLIYLTDNRIVGLYHDPKGLFKLIEHYNISYIVTGRFYTDYYHLAENSVEFVRNNPDEFELIATIQEDYSEFYAEEDPAGTDEIYIYKVKSSDEKTG